MGTTSEKLTYLNTTKEKIRNSINLTGNGVFSVSVTDGNLLEQTLTI